MEGLSVADGLEVFGKDEVTIDQGGASGTRKPGGGGRAIVLGEAKGGRSQGGAGGWTGRGGVNDPESEVKTLGTFSLDGAGDWRTQGRSAHLNGVNWRC